MFWKRSREDSSGVEPAQEVTKKTEGLEILPIAIRFHHLLNWAHFSGEFAAKAIPQLEETRNVVSADVKTVYAERQRIVRSFCYEQAQQFVQQMENSYRTDKTIIDHTNTLETFQKYILQELGHPEAFFFVTDRLAVVLKSLNQRAKNDSLNFRLYGQNFAKGLITEADRSGSPEMADFATPITDWLTKQDVSLSPDVSQALGELSQYFNDSDWGPLLKQLFFTLIQPLNRNFPAGRAMDITWIQKYLEMAATQRDLTKLEQFVQKKRHDSEVMIKYPQDLAGITEGSDPRIRAAFFNKVFLAYYRFARTLVINPNEDVVFTDQPDLICKAAQGGSGEGGVAKHCVDDGSFLPEALTKEGDQAMSEALLAVQQNATLSQETRGLIRVEAATETQPLQIKMPIKLFVDQGLIGTVLADYEQRVQALLSR